MLLPSSGRWTVLALGAFGVALSAEAPGPAQRQPPPVHDAPVRASGAGPTTAAAELGFDADRLRRIDAIVEAGLANKEAPGAVVVVGRRGRVAYHRAFGYRALVPEREPMTEDTIFDAASLTKVVATTTAVMLLVEEGRIRLSDRVTALIPEFGRYGKAGITIGHLLTHMSGLRPDLDWSLPWEGYETAIRMACEEVPVAAPDERFIYSDINFFLLGDIVARVSGQRLDAFVRERVFAPLGMRDTTFLPPESLRSRIAPTEACAPYDYPCEGPGPGRTMLRGVVHDPTARRMLGVAGHAGLFTSASDLTRFAGFLLGGGALDGVRVLSPLTVGRMTSPATPPHEPNLRGLGWDVDSSYSANRGELIPLGSFGHTGFTGTSIWVDPGRGLFVIFLSNRVHPDGKGDVTVLRSRVATAAAAALVGDVGEAPAWRAARLLAPATAPPVRPELEVNTGIDVLRAQGFAALAGRRMGLVTNHTGRARDGSATIDLLARTANLTLIALFSPEHGIRGAVDEKVSSSIDEKTRLPIHSLYGDTQRPTDSMLQGIDTMVVDLQDVGSRFYTYPATMAYVMEESVKRGIKVVVLDRPNPIGGFRIEGPALDPEFTGFTGYRPMPVRHGMTLGELARMFNEEAKIGADLTVVEMTGWRRDAWWDETGLPWVNPSPNIRNLVQATLYPGIGAIEWSNLSVGRGTDTPFEQVGAPWIDASRLASRLNARAIPGIRFYPVAFTPASSKYAGEPCRGVYMVVTDREALPATRVGVEIAAAVLALHPDKFEWGRTEHLLGSKAAVSALSTGADPAKLVEGWAADEARWRLRRAPFLIYR